MSFIGEFREREINGEPFLTFTSSSLKDSPSSSSSSSGETTIDSGCDNLPLQPLFLCPLARCEAEKLKRGGDKDCLNVFMRYNTSPQFDQEKHFLDSNNFKCKLPVLPLFWCNNKDRSDLWCTACFSYAIGTGYYLCVTCDNYFHRECVECPLEIKHPSYPFISLQLFCGYNRPKPNLCCQILHSDIMVYHCPINKCTMHLRCALKPIPIFINHLKRHPHPLTFFPKQNYLPCNICGLIHDLSPAYVCARCVFVVHQDCIFFPHVIRISRHCHRISFISSLGSGKWSCGVCRRTVDNDCGAYACNKCENYVVHPRCATRKDLWDGVDLEGVPEEPEIVVEPFEKISDGIILHFSHGHHLKLQISRVYDPRKFCQACVLPIYEGNYYSCGDECDFILHEKCANAPRKKHHGLHAHPLTLKVDPTELDGDMGFFSCGACTRRSSGFFYEDYQRGHSGFKLDIRCGLVEEPFEYKGHKHLLYLALKPEEEKVAKCRFCKDAWTGSNSRKLNCVECEYIICFFCATLPYTARYKHDKHFLTFRASEEEASDHSDWCDVCERKMEISKISGFYTCDKYCCTTLHIDCLLGKDMYMKPGQTITWSSVDFRQKFDIFGNNTMSRPFCHYCKQRCQEKVVFIAENVTVCCVRCTYKYAYYTNPVRIKSS